MPWKPRKPYSPDKAAVELKNLQDAGQGKLYQSFLDAIVELAKTPDGVSAAGLQKRLGIKTTTVSHLSRIWAGLNGVDDPDRNEPRQASSSFKNRSPSWHRPIQRAIDEAVKQENAIYVMGLEAQNEALKAEINEIDTQLGEVTEESLRADAACAQMKDEVGELRSKLDERGRSIGALQQKNEDLEVRVEVAEADAARLRGANEELATQVAESERSVAVLEEQLRSEQSKVDELCQSLAQSNAALTGAQGALSQLQERLDARGQELSSLKQHNAGLVDAIRTADGQVSELRQKNLQYAEALSTAKMAVAVLEEQRRHTDAELAGAREQLSESNRRAADQESEIRELQSQVRRLMNVALAPAN